MNHKQVIETIIQRYYVEPKVKFPGKGDNRKYAAIAAVVQEKLRKTENGEWSEWDACFAEIEQLPLLKNIVQFTGHQGPSLGFVSVFDSSENSIIKIEECYTMDLSLLAPIFTMHQNVRVRLLKDDLGRIDAVHNFLFTKAKSTAWAACFDRIMEIVNRHFPMYTYMPFLELMKINDLEFHPLGVIEEEYPILPKSVTAYDLLFSNNYWAGSYSLV